MNDKGYVATTSRDEQTGIETLTIEKGDGIAWGQVLLEILTMMDRKIKAEYEAQFREGLNNLQGLPTKYPTDPPFYF